MSGKRHSTWIRIWRSLKWPSHTRLHDAAQAVTETETSPIPPPLPAPADPAHEAVDRPEIATEAFVKVPPIHLALPIQPDPIFDFEAVDPGLGAEQALAWLLRKRSRSAFPNLSERPPVTRALPMVPRALPVEADTVFDFKAVDPDLVVEQAIAALPLILPLLPVNAEPTCEADEPTETTVSVQRSRPTTDFALPGRLAVVAKLNVPSIRDPRHRPYRLPPGKAVRLAARAQSAHVGRPPRLEAMKPTTRLIVQKPATPIPAVVINLEAVRKAVQSSPAAKHAA